MAPRSRPRAALPPLCAPPHPPILPCLPACAWRGRGERGTRAPPESRGWSPWSPSWGAPLVLAAPARRQPPSRPGQGRGSGSGSGSGKAGRRFPSPRRSPGRGRVRGRAGRGGSGAQGRAGARRGCSPRSSPRSRRSWQNWQGRRGEGARPARAPWRLQDRRGRGRHCACARPWAPGEPPGRAPGSLVLAPTWVGIQGPAPPWCVISQEGA